MSRRPSPPAINPRRAGLVKSRKEAERLITQGGVEVDGQRVKDPKSDLSLSGEILLKVGKRNYLKVKV